MKISASAIALLGLPVAMAAILPITHNAHPARPEPALGLPGAGPQPTALGSVQQQESKQEVANADAFAEADGAQRGAAQRNWWHDIFRRAAEPIANAVAATTTPPVHNTFTHANKTTAPATTAAASGTEIAVFTAAGAVFTVTEISGHAAVDGKSLVPGGPAQLIGGEYISEGSSGAIAVNGQTLTFEAYSSSSQAPAPAPQPSSAAAGSSASSGGGSGATSSSSGGVAEPLQTAALKVVVAIGVVAGAMVL